MFEGKMTVSCILLIMMMVHGMKSEDILPTPNGIKFLGIGYNIIEGNPEGGGLISGGVDPGLLVSRRVFDLHYDNGKTSNDGQYRIPDEVYFLHRQSAYTSATRTTFHGTSSYQSKLSAQVSVSASVGGFFAKARFAASARYQRIATRTSNSGSVFLATEEVKNLGHARYLTELARPERHRLNAGFVAASCNLPGSYDEAAYMEFLDTWGTHVVTEVDLGTREGENYEEDRSSFVKYASQHVGVSVSASATVIGKFGASLAVDMESFNRAMESGTSFGSSYTKYKLGSDTLREPISLTMIGMHELFDDDYWTRLSEFVDSGHCTNSWNRTDTRSNMLKAMKGYAKWKQISESGDPSIVVPVTWPEGTYGLPKPISGCPNTEFTWNEGYRLHDTEYYSHNHWTNPLNLDGHTALYSVQQHFCMKTVDTVDSNSHWFWQPGSYCIYKYGDCPSAEETEHLKRKEIPRLESEIIEEQLKREREIDRLSSYICRENIVIMGIPEKSEKEDTEKVVKEFYKVNLGLTDEQIGSIEHQRVHRVPATARPRPIKARFLRYSDKIMIQSNSAKLKGSSYFIMDDLPKRVRDERRLQIPALKAARNEGRLAFFSRAEPWKLFVDGKFLSRDEQKKFVEMAGKRRPNPKTSDNSMEVAEGSQRDLQSVGTGEDLVGAVGGV